MNRFSYHIPNSNSPFGSVMPGRVWSDATRNYRYGFNGKEKDFETANDAYDFGARIYDGRLGRWLCLDPFFKMYPSQSAFCYVINSPIYNIDIGGKYVTGHTLRFMNEITTILSGIKGADLFISLLEVNCNTNQLISISKEMFNKALLALGDNEAAKALIRGYYYAINSSIKYTVYYIKDNESVYEFANDASAEFYTKYGNYTGLELNTLDQVSGEINFGTYILPDKEKNTTYIFINQTHTNVLTVKQAWDIADGEVVYPIPKPCISLINNPINSTVGLFFLMWKLNDPFLAHARKCLSESEITPNGSHDPENPIGPITIGQEMQKICEEAMNKCTKYSYIIPEELKEIKQCGPIVTPPLMHRKSDW